LWEKRARERDVIKYTPARKKISDVDYRRCWLGHFQFVMMLLCFWCDGVEKRKVISLNVSQTEEDTLRHGFLLFLSINGRRINIRSESFCCCCYCSGGIMVMIIVRELFMVMMIAVCLFRDSEKLELMAKMKN
jgi:hypothetical protein